MGKFGFISSKSTALELIQVIEEFKVYGIATKNISINEHLVDFIDKISYGDVVYVESYSDVFSSFTDMLTQLCKALENGIVIKSIREPEFQISLDHTMIFRGMLNASKKLSTKDNSKVNNRDTESVNKVKKPGRPHGSTKVNDKVKEAMKLRTRTKISIAKACEVVGCNPRTYYRYMKTMK